MYILMRLRVKDTIFNVTGLVPLKMCVHKQKGFTSTFAQQTSYWCALLCRVK